MKPTKTHYVTLRIVFDKPCDAKQAVKGARFGLRAIGYLPARSFYSKHYGGDPTRFRVARVMSAGRAR